LESASVTLVAMTIETVGRQAELASLHSFLDRVAEGPLALVLEGEAGIGKSTLWLEVVGVARARGFRVLMSRPAEAERRLTHASLGDLFESVLESVLPALPAPRRHALEVALLVEEASPDFDPRTLGVAVRSGLEVLAADGPVVLAIDDDQWLDPSSASALAFALRRLDASAILLLLTRRLGERAETSDLERALPTDRVERLHVGPLSLGAIHHLLQAHLALTLTRPTLLRVHETSGGNPFYALELARTVGADVDPAQPLRVPKSLDELVRARLDKLPPATRESLLLAAAVARPSSELLASLQVTERVLGPALAARVIERTDETIRFTHPLLASVIYQGVSADERQRAHRRIALVVADPFDRARHVALSTASPDTKIAGVLEDAAALASSRGTPIAAAELAEHALRLTPPGSHSDRHRRALAAARVQRSAGEWTRARRILADLLAERREGSWRAEALVLLAELESVGRSASLLEKALREAPGPALRSEIHCRLAWATRFKPSSDHARAALELAEQLDDDVLRRRARTVQAILGWFAGEAAAPEELPAQARDLPSAVGGEQLVREATLAFVNTLASFPKREEARALLEREYQEWRERDEPRSSRALWGLAWVEFWGGRWALGAEYAAQARDISVQYGLEVPQDHLPMAVIAVHRGQLEPAREHSERALRLSQEQFGLRPPQHMAVLGLVERWSGNLSVAMEWLGEADRQAAAFGWGEPSVRWWSGDQIELLLELGRIQDAIRVLDVWEADAARVAREWVLAHVTRCRGLVASAQGEVDRAGFLLGRAVTQHNEVGDPFGTARALLGLGILRRRERKKRGSRDAIESALDGFDQLGAATWVVKARSELGRIGGRTREEGLTPAERRVAALVVEGRTNREVAAALFVTERTVASHLSHVYAKLGVRSRTELARQLR
jgi:DNA-binding CsgD family transcriptional regulator/tetratricopeptide (TPR) repeat protein